MRRDQIASKLRFKACFCAERPTAQGVASTFAAVRGGESTLSTRNPFERRSLSCRTSAATNVGAPGPAIDVRMDIFGRCRNDSWDYTRSDMLALHDDARKRRTATARRAP